MSNQCLLLGLFSDISQNTAVHIQNVSVYKVGGIGCQEYGLSLIHI